MVNTMGHQSWELGFIGHPNSGCWGPLECWVEDCEVVSGLHGKRSVATRDVSHARKVEDGGISSVGMLPQESSSTM